MPLRAENPRPSLPRVLYIGTAFLILALLAATAGVIWHLRQSQVLYEESRLSTLSLILAEQADRTFQSADLVITSVAQGLATAGVTDSASFDRIMASRDIHVLLKEKMSGTPQLDAVNVISRDGKLINFSRYWPAPEIDVSDRDYYQAMTANPDVKTYLSQPIQNRATGGWTIFLVHRVDGENGELLGFINGAVSLKYFEDYYQAITLRQGTSIAVLRLDGITLTRFPRTDTIGKAYSDAEHLLHGGTSSVLLQVSPVDGEMRIVAAHRLSDYPLILLASVTEEAALANWRSIAWLMSLGALGCAITITAAALAFGRQWKQQALLADARAELQRREENAEVKEATALELAYSAQHDLLTGLPNRVLLNDRIGQAIVWAHRCKKTAAVLFMDLDGFKHINDSLGHAIGDKLLQSIATRLVACVRGSDTVSRQGGDEFVVLLSGVEQPEDAAIAARRIAQAVAEPHSIDDHDFHVDAAGTAGRMLEAVGEPHSIDRHELHVTASIGLSVYPDDGLDAETLIQNADTAMYQAKEKGRQSFQFFQPDMNVRAVERQFIEESLRRAVQRHEFALHYQPIIDLTTGEITGAEALIRWTHPTRGLVPPLQFIPVAEDCGLIVPIGAWVLREACAQAQAWVDAGLPAMTMAVNVSAVEFRNEAFLENLFAILRDTGLKPTSLVVELTESVLMKHAESAASILRALRERGIQVAIDDFGTGYSSLGYLRKFPLDALKIDQSFVRQIGTAGEDRIIVTAVIGMARSLKLRVIAEGVETLEELEFLQAHDCDEVQGYYFSRPVPPEQFARLLGTGVPVAALVPRPGVVSVPAATKVLIAQSATDGSQVDRVLSHPKRVSLNHVTRARRTEDV
jgi:diguanylate cyclase (GGDEF)-like protein